MDPTIQAAWVAVGGTLLGTLAGGGVQAWAGHRALTGARADAAAARNEARDALRLQLAEERFRKLWDERRALLARVLLASNEWHQANLDLEALELEARQSGDAAAGGWTLTKLRAHNPEAARPLECMYQFKALSEEVHVLCDAEVRGAVENLRAALRAEMKAALEQGGASTREPFTKAHDLLLLAMRRELISTTAANPPPAAPDGASQGSLADA